MPVETPVRRVRKRLIACLAVAATVTLTAACGSSGSKPSTTGAPSGSVTYWYSPSDNTVEAREQFIKFNITAFEQQYPKIELDAVAKSSSTIDQNIQVALASGHGPDIIVSPGTSNAIPYAAAGYLTDLTSNYNEGGWNSKLLPWAAQAGQVDGKFVMIPQYYETLVLYYNKTLFEQNGWSVPTNRSELETLAADMEANGITPFAAGNADYQPATEWLVSAFMNEVAGPDKVYEALTGQIPWSDPAFTSTIDLLKEYFDNGWFGGGAKQYFSTSDTKKYADLADGKAGMYISGSWDVTSLQDYFGVNGNDDEFDWAPLPSLTDGVPQAYPLSVGGTLSVNSKSGNPRAALTYLDWIMSDTENMWANAAETGQEPLPVKFDASDIPSSIDPRYARIYTSLQSATEVGYTTWTSWGGKADTYIVSNIDKVINGDLSSSAFTQGLDDAFQADFSEGLIPTTYKPTTN